MGICLLLVWVSNLFGIIGFDAEDGGGDEFGGGFTSRVHEGCGYEGRYRDAGAVFALGAKFGVWRFETDDASVMIVKKDHEGILWSDSSNRLSSVTWVG